MAVHSEQMMSYKEFDDGGTNEYFEVLDTALMVRYRNAKSGREICRRMLEMKQILRGFGGGWIQGF